MLLSMRLRERALHRHLLGILWALLCCVVGGGLLLMARGYLAQPGMSAPAVPRARVLEFPSGR